MKNTSLLALTALLLSLPAAARITPYKINYQGKLLDSATNAPRNGTYKMQFVLYDAPSGGTARYTEVQSAVSVSNGVFFVQIGSAATLSPDLLADTSSYLGISVCANPPCTVDPEMTPRQQFVMSPYAYTAMQLSSDQDIRVNPGSTAYSTFTAAGNLLLSAGVSASSAVIANWVTASSATFSASGSGTGYGLTVSSGILMQDGTLDVNGGGGITNAYGIAAGSITLGGGSPLTTYLENKTCNMTVYGTTTVGTGTYTSNVCRYTQVGKTVILNWSVVTSAGTGAGSMLFGGLPVASLNLANFNQHCVIGWSGLTFAAAPGIKGYIAPNTTVITVVTAPVSAGAEAAAAIDTAATFRVQCSYLTN